MKLKNGVPLMLWDGDCGFCAKWIKKWERQTGEKVQYLPYQSFEVGADGRLKDFPQVTVGECERAVQLITPTGEHFSAAEAVLYSLHHAGRKKYLFWFYKHIPGFRFLSELAYKFVASHRGEIPL